MPDSLFFNAFNLIPGIGPVAFQKLLAYFPSLKEAWSAGAAGLKKAGLEKGLVDSIINQRPKINPEQELEKLTKAQIGIITIKDKNYPQRLKEIYYPPALLYQRGEIKPEDDLCLAIVGTRRLSYYGRQITSLIAGDLARAGLTIVSGLAKGIDALAHQAALKNQGRTIAVLGSGLNNQSIYPAINRQLAQQIISQGALISEYPIGAPPLAQQFPQRNRIISGLSRGVLVIEAPLKSGALITARNALEQNREVFAVPGSILSENSLGPNNLIKMGAKPITQANDILEELNLKPLLQTAIKKIAPDSKEEALILKTLSSEPTHIDKIIKKTKLTTAQANSTLLLMEIKGKVRNLGGGNYILS